MRFSVCIPAYNAEKYIARCVDSILSQAFDDYELLIIDDSSTDNTAELCKRYASEHERVFCFHRENKGQIITRAELVSHAKGEYCVFIDADDYILPDAFATLEKAVCQYNKSDCIIFGMKVMLRDGRTIISKENTNLVIDDKDTLYRKVLSSDDYNAVWRKCTKTDILKQIDVTPYSHIRVGEDMLHSLLIYKLCKNIVFIKDILYCYVMHDDSITHTTTLEKFQPSYMLYYFALDFMEKEGFLSTENKEALTNLYIKKMIRDLRRTAGFETTKDEKRRILSDIYEHSFELLAQDADKAVLGRHTYLYKQMQKGSFNGVLAAAGIDNFISGMMRIIRRKMS